MIAVVLLAQLSSLSGIAVSIDGDSLKLGETQVRLFGIDAPEFNQTCSRNLTAWHCGSEAANKLSKLVTGKQITCISMGQDQHGRTLGRCRAGSIDVNRQMVASGYAVAFRHYSLDYVMDEGKAKTAKLGIWSGTFTMPSDYRHAEETGFRAPGIRSGKVVSVRPTQPGGNGCAIKGNRGSNGWIYHVPGMPYYDRTRAEEMFCTESQAQAAGYRRAKVR